jgi:hypothetical protein
MPEPPAGGGSDLLRRPLGDLDPSPHRPVSCLSSARRSSPETYSPLRISSAAA